MIRLLVRFCIVIVFIYVAYVFGYKGEAASYFHYFLLISTVVLALYFDGKDLDKRLGRKTSFLGMLQFCGHILKSGCLALFQNKRKK